VFAGLPPRYDRLGLLLSLVQDRRWRAELVRQVAQAQPRRVLDVATGPAGIAIAVTQATGADVVGVDLDESMLRQGVANVQRTGLTGRIQLAVAQGERLPFRNDTFDVVSFSYLLRYVDEPATTIVELARCVRPGGLLACLEFHVPPRRGWRLLWRIYTRGVMPALGGLMGGRPWWRVGRFLGPNIEAFYTRYPMPEQVRMWASAGLSGVRPQVMSVGGGVVISATKVAASR